MLVLPEQFGAEIRELLIVHPDLERFTVAFSDNATVEDLVVDTHASAKKGEIWILHVERTPEELGVTTGATSYTDVDDWNVLVIDGLTNPSTQVAALRAIDQCLRGVLLPSATGRIEYTEGWRRITDRKADTVQAFAMAMSTNYDNLLDEIGFEEGSRLLLADGSSLLLLANGTDTLGLAD